jgi:hypothetical protein
MVFLPTAALALEDTILLVAVEIAFNTRNNNILILTLKSTT